jgi:hypothetical protein
MAAQAGDDDEFAGRDGEREVLEIVLTRAADFDECFAHNREIFDSTDPTADRRSEGEGYLAWRRRERRDGKTTGKLKIGH